MRSLPRPLLRLWSRWPRQKLRMQKLTKQERKVYDYIKAHRGCTTRDIQRDTFIECPWARFTGLRQKGVIVKSIGTLKYEGSRPFEGIAPVFVELCDADVAVNDVKRLSRFGQERGCLFPFRSERQVRPARREAACRLSVCESPSWLHAWRLRSSATPSRMSSTASRCV